MTIIAIIILGSLCFAACFAELMWLASRVEDLQKQIGYIYESIQMQNRLIRLVARDQSSVHVMDQVLQADITQ